MIGRRVRGFSLLEVLVTLGVLSLGLFAIVSLQVVALRKDYDAYLRSVAVTQITSMFNRLQAGSHPAELSLWNQANATLLPQGKGICASYNITLHWFSRSLGKMVYLTNGV